MTTVDEVLDAVRSPEPKRDRYGRYLIEGKPYTRVTTLAETIDDRYNLERWKVRTTALGLVARHDLYAQIAAARAEDRDALNRICDQAMEAGKGSVGANTGTALHSFTERVDRGEDFTPPPPWDADLDTYRATLDANGVRIDRRFIERIVVCYELGVAGTFDRLVTVDGRRLPLVADLKTGATLDFSWTSIAVQLACYANADSLYDPLTDSCEAAPEVDRRQALVIHLPAGRATCALYLVDIEAGWEKARLCADVRAWRKRKDLAQPYVADTVERAMWLTGRVHTLRDRYPAALQALAAAWPAGVPTLKQGGHTPEHLVAIANVLDDVERTHGVEFPAASDPEAGRPDPAVLDDLKARLDALPADLAAEVVAAGKAAGIPNLASLQATKAHASAVGLLIAEAEATAIEREAKAHKVITALTDGDTALVGAVRTACLTDGGSWTAVQLETLNAISAAIDAGILGYTVDSAHDGIVIIGPTHASGAAGFYKQHLGDAKQALPVVKEIAARIGLPVPRSMKEADHPALIAHVAARAITPSADSESEQP